jgi:hypothetical protein
LTVCRGVVHWSETAFEQITPQYLDGGTAVAEASVGEGRVALLDPEVNFRDHPPTYKLLFNGLYYGSAKPA